MPDCGFRIEGWEDALTGYVVTSAGRWAKQSQFPCQASAGPCPPYRAAENQFRENKANRVAGIRPAIRRQDATDTKVAGCAKQSQFAE